MFSTKSQLRKRTPENGTDRENYLSLLVDEYLNSSSLGKLYIKYKMYKCIYFFLYLINNKRSCTIYLLK